MGWCEAQPAVRNAVVAATKMKLCLMDFLPLLVALPERQSPFRQTSIRRWSGDRKRSARRTLRAS
jgi:hypothetical protein